MKAYGVAEPDPIVDQLSVMRNGCHNYFLPIWQYAPFKYRRRRKRFRILPRIASVGPTLFFIRVPVGESSYDLGHIDNWQHAELLPFAEVGVRRDKGAFTFR